MSALGSIPLTSLKTLVVVAVLAILSLLAGASLLARSAPSRCPGRTRRWLGRAVILLVPTILIASAGALVFNRSLGLVKTSGDLAKLALSTTVGTTAQSGGEADVNAQSAAASELDATFTKTEDGMLQTTWTGRQAGSPRTSSLSPRATILPPTARPTRSSSFSTATPAAPTALCRARRYRKP